MIDSKGNKIIKEASAVDTDFTLAELRFIMKGFYKNPSVERAMRVASAVKLISDEYKTLSSDAIEKISELEQALEEYVSVFDSEDFVWELIYILRNLARNACSGQKYSNKAAELIRKSALLFDRVCEIAPGIYNFSCRVAEYRLESTYCTTYLKTRSALETAEKFFIQIKPEKDQLYLRIATLLYAAFYDCYMGLRERASALEAIKKAIEYAYQLYNGFPMYKYLDKLASYYMVYANNEGYNYAEEAERLDEIIDLVQSWCEKTDDDAAKVHLEKLKALRDSLKK